LTISIVIDILALQKKAQDMKKTVTKLFYDMLLISSLILIAGLVIIYMVYDQNVYSEIIYGYVASLVIFILNFLSINWSFNKSLKTFLTVTLGGMFFRIFLIGVMLFFIIRYYQLNHLFFIGSFFTFYLIYQVIEVRVITRKVHPHN